MNLQDNVNKFMDIIHNKDFKYIMIGGYAKEFDFRTYLTDIDVNIKGNKLDIKGNKLDLNIYLNTIKHNSLEYEKGEIVEGYNFTIKTNDSTIILSYFK